MQGKCWYCPGSTVFIGRNIFGGVVSVCDQHKSKLDPESTIVPIESVK